jgi:serine protease AprX
MKKALIIISALVLTLALHTASAVAAPRVDATLTKLVNSSPLALTPVVITYNHQPSSADFAALKSLGIKSGVYLDRLPMVMTAINKAQLNALSTRSDIRSLYANHKLDLMDDKSRPFIGVTALRADREVTNANNSMPVFGTGVGVAYVDTGIDATHPDLQLGRNVIGNVFFPLAEPSAIENPVGDFLPVVAVEDAPLSDVEGGLGTFGAGVTAGTGQASGTFYGGVAPGAKLLGLVAGNDGGLTSFGILQAFNYALANQFRYNIRVCNNSWGGSIRSMWPRSTCMTTTSRSSLLPATAFTTAASATPPAPSIPTALRPGPSVSPRVTKKDWAIRPASLRAAKITAPAATWPAHLKRVRNYRRPICGQISPAPE